MRRLIGILVSTGICLLLAASSASAATGWSSPVKVWNGDYSRPSMVVDGHGKAHIAARGDSGLWYLTNKSGTWTRTRLTTDVVGDDRINLDNQPSIAVDPSDGSLTIVFVNVFDMATGSCNVRLEFITNRGGAWSAPRTIPANGCLGSPSVVVRHGKLAVVALHQWFGDYGIRFLTNVTGHWTQAWVVHSVGEWPRFRSAALTLDGQGKARVSYARENRVSSSGDGVFLETVRYASSTTKTGTFTSENVAPTSSTPRAITSTSIALDSHDRPRVAWTDGQTHIANRGASGWHSSRIVEVGDDARLIVDSHDRARVVAVDKTGGLWYAARSAAGTWHTVPLDTHPVAALGGVAIGPSGRVYVVYQRGDASPRVWFTHTS